MGGARLAADPRLPVALSAREHVGFLTLEAQIHPRLHPAPAAWACGAPGGGGGGAEALAEPLGFLSSFSSLSASAAPPLCFSLLWLPLLVPEGNSHRSPLLPGSSAG